MFSGVTELPDDAVLVTAGVVPAVPPDGNTKIWKAGPDAGAGVHWKAQPMFHGPAATVKGVLVHAPFMVAVGPSRTWTEPDGAGDVVVVELDEELPVAAVVVVDPAAVVEVVADVVLVEPWVEPLGTGSE